MAIIVSLGTSIAIGPGLWVFFTLGSLLAFAFVKKKGEET
jgi:hypothetical protein